MEKIFLSKLMKGMITDKMRNKNKKSILVFVCIMIALLTLCSCQNDSESDEIFEELMAQSESESSTSSEEQEKPFADKLYVIIPENASGELSEKSRALAEKIKEKTNVETVLKYDNETVVVTSEEIVMYIGNGDHLITKEMFQRLRIGDYVCKWDKNSIVLGGRYEEATLEAIDAFEKQILPGASNASLMRKDYKLEELELYDVNSVTVNGYDLYDYKLLYDDGGLGKEKGFAEFLQAYVAESTGYYLEILPYSEKEAKNGKSIIIDKLFAGETSHASVELKNKNIILSGSDEYALSMAVADIAEELARADEEGNATVTVDDIRIYNGEREGFSVGIFENSASTGEDIKKLKDITDFMADDPALVIVSGLSETLWTDISQISRRVEYTYLSAEDGGVPLIYKTDCMKKISKSNENNLIYYDLEDSSGNRSRVVYLYDNDENTVKSLKDILCTDSRFEFVISKEAIAADEMDIGENPLEMEGFLHKIYCRENLSAEYATKDSSVFGVDLYSTYCEEYIALKNTVN